MTKGLVLGTREIMGAVLGRPPYYLVWWPPTALLSTLHSSLLPNISHPCTENVFMRQTDHLEMSYDTDTPLVGQSGDNCYKLLDDHAPANNPTSHPEPLAGPRLDPCLLNQGDDGFGGPPSASGNEHVFLRRTNHAAMSA